MNTIERMSELEERIVENVQIKVGGEKKMENVERVY